MCGAIKDVFERHTLLNKLAARRKLYTAVKGESESVLQFANRIYNLSATLKSMTVMIDDTEMAMALLNGLLEQFDSHLSMSNRLSCTKSKESECEMQKQQ